MPVRTPGSVGLIAGLLVALALPATALGQAAPQPPAQSGQAAADTPVTYVPPFRGIPGKRISGATRGIAPASGSHGLQILALAPDGVSLTMQEQPTLYWYASQAVPGGAEVTISADSSEKTVLKTKLAGPIPAGINAFPTAGTSARLVGGETYTWTVTAIVSPTDPMKNAVVSSQIERTAKPKLAALPAGGDANAAAAAYAKAGLWYEAVDALSRGLQAAPADKRLHRSRAALLTQVGLSTVAEDDSIAAR
jgi:Domain of Unknown Function (DUF928)